MKIIMILTLLAFPYILLAGKPKLDNNRRNLVNDTTATAIEEQFRDNKNGLYYPETVKSFYKQVDYKLLWVLPDTVKNHTWKLCLCWIVFCNLD